ncbi:serine hydrolase domain-containing protein [Methylobacterium sp. A52T]
MQKYDKFSMSCYFVNNENHASLTLHDGCARFVMSAMNQAFLTRAESVLKPILDKITSTDPNISIVVGWASPTDSVGVQTKVYNNGTWKNNLNQSFSIDPSIPNWGLFEIASISKTFTSTLYQLFLSDTPDKTLGEYQGPAGPFDFNAEFQTIQLNNLMNYTSGLPSDNDGYGKTVPLPDGSNPPQPYSEKAMMNYLKYNSIQVSPQGENYTYSNLGFAIMAEVIKFEVPDTDLKFNFPGIVKKYIFEEIGMSSLFFDDTPMDQLNLSYSCEPSENSYICSPAAPGWPLFPAYFGAGGIVASPNDMSLWLQFNMGMIKSATLTPLLATLLTPQANGVFSSFYDDQAQFGPTTFGYGWFLNLEQDMKTVQTIWKDGGFDNVDTYMCFLPSSDNVSSQAGVFVLLNAAGIYVDVTIDGTIYNISAACYIANNMLCEMQSELGRPIQAIYPSTRRPKGRG